MEKSFENLKRWTIRDLELADEDLQAIMTMGLTVSGTFLNLLRLKKILDDVPEIHVIYPTISSSHLRIVKKEHWEEWNKWRKNNKLPPMKAVG